MAEEYILTQEGLDKLKAEYDELVSVKRAEVSERLKEAISYGDLSENAEYDAAKDEQAEVEERIFKLEKMIKGAKVIDDSEVNNDFVGVGSKVKLLDLDENEEYEYVIVGTTEADPFNGKISNESLLGQAILGKQAAEEVEFTVPDGIRHFRIVEISR